MDEHAAGFSKPEGASKKTAVARERKMAHFPRGLAASFGGNEFVVFPECAVDQSEIAFVHEALPIFADSRKARSIEEPLLLLQLLQKEKRFFYAPSLPGVGEDWQRFMDESDLALVDGTFWKDDELVSAKRSRKTAREMGHLPLSGNSGLLRRPFRLGKTRRVLIHLNNTNPALNEESPEHRAVREAGWEIAYDGMEFEL